MNADESPRTRDADMYADSPDVGAWPVALLVVAVLAVLAVAAGWPLWKLGMIP